MLLFFFLTKSLKFIKIKVFKKYIKYIKIETTQGNAYIGCEGERQNW